MLINICVSGVAQDSIVSSELEYPLIYQADDSLELDMKNQKAYLYNNAYVEYGDFELNACFIEFDFKTQVVKARECTDSSGNKVGVPELSDGDVVTHADSLAFNFNSKRGITYHVKMQEGEGYIHGSKIKRQANEEIHIDTALYTTCDLDHPHYYFKLRKAIIKPDDKIISGPVNLFVSDVSTPLGLPFAYFPNQKSGTNGIVIPSFGNSPRLGFYLLGGGYYYKFKKRKDGKWSPFADKLAVSLLGDIYSKGSWGAKTIVEYNNRYHYNGGLQVSYQNVKNGDKGFPDYTQQKVFFIRWRHNQDPKAMPNSTFKANVNYGKKNNFKNNYSDFNPQDYLSNNFNSNVGWNRRFNGAVKSNLNINLRHNQNNQKVTFTLPETSYNINRFYLGKLLGKSHIGKPRWYEQIGTTYALNFKNITSAKIDSSNNFDNQELLNNMQYGAKHDIRATSSLRLLKKKFTLTPSYGFTLYNYFEDINIYYDDVADSVITDTTERFSMPFTQNFSVGLTTKIYGFYQFAKFLQGKRQSKIRHSITPNASFVYRPKNPYSKTYIDKNGKEQQFNRYKIGVYGAPSSNESGIVAISLINSFELKYKDIHNDTSDNTYKKMSLLDNLNLSSNYNLLADSFNLSNINITGRTKLFKNINTRFGVTIDPYAYDTTGRRLDIYNVDYNGKLGTIMNTNFALGMNLRSKQGKKDKYQSTRGTQAELDAVNSNQSAYVDFNVPWNLNLNYKISTNRTIGRNNDGTKKDTTIFVQTIGVRGDLKITENWMINYTTNYDIVKQKFSFSSVDIRRDLHCWEMVFHWIPFGYMKSYSIQINVKSAMLQDLKLQRRRTWYDTGVR